MKVPRSMWSTFILKSVWQIHEIAGVKRSNNMKLSCATCEVCSEEWWNIFEGSWNW